MSSDSPASILFDENGNPIGVINDGITYRLQVEAKITDGYSTVGITDVVGSKALKVDVVKTVASGSAGSGGTSSNFDDPFPVAGTAAGFTDGYFMRDAQVFDVDTGAGAQYVLGVNLRKASSGGSIDFGTLTDPVRIDPIGATAQPVSYADSPNLDPFSRLRVSQPYTIFDCKNLMDASPLFFDDQQISGGGTSSAFIANQSSVQMSVSNLTAGTRVRQTFRRFQYQPGKGQQILLTGIVGTGVSGITRRLGYFDGYNGLFFELAGATLNVVCRTFTSGSVIDNKVAQNSWNIDKLDGTGISGITLDISKNQIFIIDFQWLGIGRVRYGFDIDGKIYYCHQLLNANNLSIVYMQYPNLPIRYEISNDGTGPVASLFHVCSSVQSEGGIENNGFTITADRGLTTFTTADTSDIYPLIAIRLKTTALFVTIRPFAFSIICTTTAAYRYILVLNPVVSGTALSFNSITNSAVEAATTATNETTLSGGDIFFSGYGQAGSNQGVTTISVPSELTIGSNIAGTADILVLAIQKITGTSEDFYGSLSWGEQI